jgi:hypothetical protein
MSLNERMPQVLGKRYVQPSRSDGGWEVLKEGHRRATIHTATQEQAVAQARTLARQEGGGKISVLDRTGKVSETKIVRGSASARSSR